MDDYLTDLQRTQESPTVVFFIELLKTERLCHVIDQELFPSDSTSSICVRDLETIKTKFRTVNLELTAAPSTNRFNAKVEVPLQIAIPYNACFLVNFGRFASSLYAHELAWHVDHSIHEFAAHFTANSLKTCDFVDAQYLNTSPLSMLQSIIAMSQGLLDAFLGLHIFDEMHKAITVLAKGVGDFIHADELRLEAYLEQLIVLSKRLIGNDERNSLSRVFLIMTQLRDWLYLHPFKTLSSADETEGMGSLRFQTDNGQLNSAFQATTGIPSGPLLAWLTLEPHVDLKHCGQLDIPGSKLEELIPPAMASCSPPHTAETVVWGTSAYVDTDDWFWEFFNIDMLN
ncbi:uncharacterized protein ATNIH1004_001585 [Aspergillus tanneri]|uniref:Uncharacterized protein n=1 Tax=Aspergillus tanneri TaxID=1220188 RepID=A0A5M9N4P5_9EURO|nr:uncharacterized protein ATNIH1004_001585 [Aspergillus tanneri]KAA8652680.1 hypothetical protein ATNIH1004_001585 [Aspergillus tanneri]